MYVLVTCKYEADPIKNEGATVVTTLYSNFSDGQGQITLVLVSVSGRNLNSSKLSCMSSLPARTGTINNLTVDGVEMKRFQHVPKCSFVDFHVFFHEHYTVKTVHICHFTDRYYLWNDRFSVLS